MNKKQQQENMFKREKNINEKNRKIIVRKNVLKI